MNFNLADLFERVADTVPEREALVCGDRRFTYGELDERATRLAHALADRGVAPGDHVGLWLHNDVEYLEGMLAAFKLRAVPINVNYRYVADELRYLFDDSRCRAVIHEADFAPVLDEIRADLPLLTVTIAKGDEYESALRDASPVRDFAERSSDDLYILYTGGTTGMPKGVLWRQHDIFIAGMGGRSLQTWETVTSYEQLAQRALAGTGRTMMLAPLMHGAAQWSAFTAISDGATIILPPNPRRLDPAEVWRTVARERATKISMVGDAMGRPLVQELESGGYDTSSVRLLVNGGAALNQEIKKRFLALIPGLTVKRRAPPSALMPPAPISEAP